jgi:hypothetical protein
MAELTRIGMSFTQATAAVGAILGRSSGAERSNGIGQVAHFNDFTCALAYASSRVHASAQACQPGTGSLCRVERVRRYEHIAKRMSGQKALRPAVVPKKETNSTRIRHTQC